MAKKDRRKHLALQRQGEAQAVPASESGKEYRRLVELSFDGIVIHEEGTTVFVNPAGAKLFGAETPEQLIGKPIMDFVHPDYRGIVKKRVQAVSEGEKIPLIEEQFIRLDGTTVDVEVIGTSTTYEGRPAVQVVFRDITERKQAEEALRESEERYRTLVETSPDAISITDLSGKLIMANQRNAELHGCESAEELLGLDAFELIAPEDRQRAVENTRKTLETGSIRNVEYTMLRQDGSSFSAELSASLIVDAEGEPTAFIGVVRDITQRKRAEDELRESERRLKEAQAMGRIGSWEYDVEDNSIEWSEQTYNLYERDLALGPPTVEEEAAYYTPEQARTLREYARRAIEEGREFEYDLQARLPSGKSAHFSATMHPVKNENGQVVKLFGTVQDITERKQAEDALKRAELEKETILDSLVEHVIYEDTELKILWPNRAACESAGWVREELTGRHCYEIWPKSTEPCPDCPILEAIRTGQPRQIEKATPDGRVWFIRGYPVRDEGDKVIGAVEVTLEITERKQAQEALQESEGKYRALVEQSLQGLVIAGSDGIVFANSVVAEMIGYTIEELMSLSPNEVKAIIHPDDQAFVWNRFGERLIGKPLPQRYEFRVIRKDGTVRWMEMVASRIEYGGLPAVQVALVDITERKQAEEELRESEETARALLNAPTESAILLDTAGTILAANETVAQRLGKRADELIGLCVYDLFQPAVAELRKARVDKAVRTGKSVRFEDERVGRDFDSSVYPILDAHGNVVRVAVFARDITSRKQLEHELEERRLYLESLLASAPDAIVTLDAHHRILEWNPGAEKLFGYTRDEVVGRDIDELVTGSDAATFEEAATLTRQVLAGEDILPTETVRYRKDGSPVDVILSGAPIMLGDEMIGVMAVYTDVTQRKRAEEALRLTQFSIDHLSTPALWIKADGRIAYVNQAACAALGYTEKELRSIAILDIDPNYNEDIWPQRWQRLKKQGSLVVESLHRRKDGTTFPVEVSANFLEFAGDEYNVSFARDISDRKQAEKERERLLAQIQEQAKRVERIVSTLPEGILLLNADGRILLANPVAQAHLGLLADVQVGDTLTRLGQRPLAELLTPPPEGLWHEVAVKNRCFEAIAQPLETGLEGWVLSFRDVTQEREIQQRVQQQERLAAVGQLAGGIAHDFNNLLTTIMLYAQMPLDRRDLPPGLTRALETILTESRQAAKLIEQILDFSRRSPIEARPVDLKSFVQDAIRIFQRTIPESISPLLEVEPGEYTVSADPTRIQQVLMNLVVNARDAMPKGGKLTIGLSRIKLGPDEEPPVAEMSSGEWVCLSVADTGTGIPPEALPHIFEPFFTTKPLGQGTGLGLAQVYGIVRQHGGHIGFETEEGRGTTFRIYFPVYRAEGRKEPPKEAAPVPQGRGETILLVEDNTRIQEAGRTILESLGYQVLTAVNGREALQVYRSAEKVDLVLTDIVMPEMGGKELVQELRKTEPRLKALAITGYTLEESLQELREEGILDVVRKPFDATALARAVRDTLDTD